jgi:nicotinamidase-related amidase
MTLPVGPHPANRWLVGDGSVDISKRDPRPARKVTVAAEPVNVVIDLTTTAVVVVDMQNDFCADEGYLGRCGVDCAPARKLIEPINRVMRGVRPHGVPVVWVNWAVRADRLDIGPSMPHLHVRDAAPSSTEREAALLRMKGGWGAFAGEWGAKIVDGLEVHAGDVHVAKRRFSGFFATELDAVLRSMGVRTLFFAGVATDICVMATLQDAMFLGYDVVMMDDCVSTNSPDFCVAAARHHVRELFGFLTSSVALLAGISGS